MGDDKRRGAGAHLGSILERQSAPPNRPPAEGVKSPGEPTADAEPKAGADDSGEPTTGKGRGGARKGASSLTARQAKKIKGRTIYLADDLFERVMVQAHRRELTISDYVAWILNRHVPDHRGRGAGEAEDQS